MLGDISDETDEVQNFRLGTLTAGISPDSNTAPDVPKPNLLTLGPQNEQRELCILHFQETMQAVYALNSGIMTFLVSTGEFTKNM